MIYGDFKRILILENNRKQNLSESYTNKYQIHVGCSSGFKLVCVDDQFSKHFKSYLGQDAVHTFITTMAEESKYCSHVMKFDKELVLTKEDNENFESFTKCSICDNTSVEGDVKVRDHSHVTRKYIDSAQKDCHINFSLNYKILIVFHSTKNYHAHLIIQELCKFEFELNVIPNGLEKYMSFSLDIELVFINNFQFLSFP